MILEARAEGSAGVVRVHVRTLPPALARDICDMEGPVRRVRARTYGTRCIDPLVAPAPDRPYIARMTETETKWAERVAAWQASGQTAPAFCKGNDFTPSGLRYWASRLAKANQGAPAKEVRLARVVRASQPAEAMETPIVIEVGAARLGVRRGFDPEALRAVLDVLGGGR